MCTFDHSLDASTPALNMLMLELGRGRGEALPLAVLLRADIAAADGWPLASPFWSRLQLPACCIGCEALACKELCENMDLS